MPAIFTHHIFGEQVALRLPEGTLDGPEELLAFLLGSQGPDPMLARFRTSYKRAKLLRHLAQDMHAGHMTSALMGLRSGVGRLAPEERGVGRAFCLGMLSHWLLDSTVHPFVYWEQAALADADPSLEGRGGEVHAVIESEIDSWVLWEFRHATVLECPPADELARTERIDEVAGALVSSMALGTFGVSVGAREYPSAVADFEWVYRLIEPATSPRVRLLAGAERRLLHSSHALAQAHYPRRSDGCALANLSRLPWTDPWTGAARTDSVADLFDQACERWDDLARSYVMGDEDALRAQIGGINYEGRPVPDPDR